MISEEITEDIGTAVAEIMKKEGVWNYEYKIEGKSECGDNYMGEVIFVRVDSEEDDTKTYHLVVKTAKRLKELREKFPIDLYYSRELFMYSEIFPTFRKFIQEVNPKFKSEFVPKMYWIKANHGKETVVLENLKTEGFKLYDRKKPWNIQHSKFTMKKYGRFHALSMALRDQKPELFDELKKNLGAIAPNFTENFEFKKFFDKVFGHVMELLEKTGRDDLVKKYNVLMDEVENLFNCRTEEDDKLALCHMDCWNNNFMFKYENEDETTPAEIRFLDFQLSLLDSPAKDLSYNIYATCDNTCLKHFDELLETYYESLRDSLESLGSDPQKFFSMEELRRHWRKYGIYGVFLSLNLIKMQLLNKEDAPSLEEMVEDNLVDGFKVKVTDQEEYDRRILDVFLHFGDNFL